MRLDDLTRELRAQAEETRSWPMPSLDLPPRRGVARHPGRTVAVVLASAAAVVLALVTVPRMVEQSRPTPQGGVATPSPTVEPEPGIREWRALRCPSRTARTCPVPWLMVAAGQEYASGTGAGQPVHNPSGMTRSLSVNLTRYGAGRLVMVGATHTGPGSQLVARVGERKPISLASGLTLLPLPASPRPLEVSVTEQGTPTRRQTLVIEEYRPVRQ